MKKHQLLDNLSHENPNMVGIAGMLMQFYKRAESIQLVEKYDDELDNRLWELFNLLVAVGVVDEDALTLTECYWSRPIRQRLKCGQRIPAGECQPSPVAMASFARFE